MNIISKPLWFWPVEQPGISRVKCKPPSGQATTTIKAICAEVAEKHGITIIQLMSHRRTPEFCIARDEAYYRCASETINSYPNIGRLMGGRNHVTIIRGALRHAERHGLDMP